MTPVARWFSVCFALLALAACGQLERRLEGRLFLPDYFGASIVTDRAWRASPMSSRGISVIGLAVRETSSFDVVDGRAPFTVDVYETTLGSCFEDGRITHAITAAIERTPGYSVVDISDKFDAVTELTASDSWTGIHSFTEGSQRATELRAELRADYGLDAVLLIDEARYLRETGSYPDARNGKGIRARSSKDNHIYAYFTVRAFDLATGVEIEGTHFNQGSIWHYGPVSWSDPPADVTRASFRGDLCRKFRLLDENNLLWAMKKLKFALPDKISLPDSVWTDIKSSK